MMWWSWLACLFRVSAPTDGNMACSLEHKFGVSCWSGLCPVSSSLERVPGSTNIKCSEWLYHVAIGKGKEVSEKPGEGVTK
jgi:hypothetical protein